MSTKSLPTRIYETLTSLAAIAALLIMALSALYCAVAVVLSVIVDHIGWFASLQPLSAQLMAHVDTAAFVFATVCLGVAIAASGVPLVIGVLAFVAIVAAVTGLGYGLGKIFALIGEAIEWVRNSPWAPDELGAVHLWWILAGAITALMVLFACSTMPRNRHATLIAAGPILLVTCALAAARVVWALIDPQAAPTWSFVGAVVTCSLYVIFGSVLLQGFVARAPPQADAKETFETWLATAGVVSALIAVYASWHYVREGLLLQSWLASSAMLVAVLVALGVIALLTVGAVLAIVLPEGDGEDPATAAIDENPERQ